MIIILLHHNNITISIMKLQCTLELKAESSDSNNNNALHHVACSAVIGWDIIVPDEGPEFVDLCALSTISTTLKCLCCVIGRHSLMRTQSPSRHSSASS